MAYSLNERPESEAARTHPTGTMWCPHGTILVYAFKKPWGKWQDEKVEKQWELVLRTDKPLAADRVEQCWKRNGFEVKRG